MQNEYCTICIAIEGTNTMFGSLLINESQKQYHFQIKSEVWLSIISKSH